MCCPGRRGFWLLGVAVVTKTLLFPEVGMLCSVGRGAGGSACLVSLWLQEDVGHEARDLKLLERWMRHDGRIRVDGATEPCCKVLSAMRHSHVPFVRGAMRHTPWFLKAS